MAEMTNELENRCINRFLRGASDAAVTAYVGFLSAVSNAETGALADLTEITADVTTDYARQLAGFTASTTGTTANAGLIDFTESGAGYNAPITHVAIFSAATSGVALMIKALGSSKTIGAGDTPTIAIGALTVTFD